MAELAEPWRLVTSCRHNLLGSCLVIIIVFTAVRITIAVSMYIKVTHIFTCHVPIGNVDHLVAHFTPDINSFEKVTACAAQLRSRKEL